MPVAFATAGTSNSLTGGAAKASSPRPHVEGLYIKTHRPNGFKSLVVKFAGKLASCSNARPAKIKVTLKAKGIRYSMRNTWCKGELGVLNLWNQSGDFFTNLNDVVDDTTLMLEPNPSGLVFATHIVQGFRRTVGFGYWVVIDGKLARSGRLEVRVDSYLRTIRDSEDDFVNVCINESERLYSSGGRLFCSHEEFSYSMKLVR